MKRIDLHVHSNISDGTLSPEEVAHLAHASGLSAIALTDHDTFDGVQACKNAAAPLGIEVIAGVELSARYEGREIHILGLNIDITDEHFRKVLDDLKVQREKRNAYMLEKLNALGFALTFDDLLAHTGEDEIITRAHFARALFEKGYIKNRNDAFTKYIGDGQPAYVPKECLDAKQCIALIHQAGGKAVLAHPMLYKYTKAEITVLIETLKAEGLDGVEVIYPKHSPEEMSFLRQLCRKENLILTGGSDFHGSNKPDIALGKGYGDTLVPYRILEDLF